MPERDVHEVLPEPQRVLLDRGPGDEPRVAAVGAHDVVVDVRDRGLGAEGGAHALVELARPAATEFAVRNVLGRERHREGRVGEGRRGAQAREELALVLQVHVGAVEKAWCAFVRLRKG